MPDLWLPHRVADARSAGRRMKGLLGRDDMRPDDALWIAPCRSVHTFAMKFPIDVAFLDRDGRVVHLVPSMRPWRLTRYVLHAFGALELRAGTLAACGARVGDRIRWAQDTGPAPG